MEFKTIHKVPSDWKAPPNLLDYSKTYQEFSWDQILKELDRLPDGRRLQHRP